MAAMVFTEHLRRAGLDSAVTVSSAGTGPWHIGEPADPRAVETLRAAGYPVDHVAEQVGDQHLAADLVLAADRGHRRSLLAAVDDPSRVRLLRSFDPDAGDDADVPDPYYGDGDGFSTVLTMIEATMPGLLDWVRQHR